MSALLKQADLLEWTGYSRAADLEKWLKSRRIAYDKGRGGKIVTTQSAIDAVFNPQLVSLHVEPSRFEI